MHNPSRIPRQPRIFARIARRSLHRRQLPAQRPSSPGRDRRLGAPVESIHTACSSAGPASPPAVPGARHRARARGALAHPVGARCAVLCCLSGPGRLHDLIVTARCGSQPGELNRACGGWAAACTSRTWLTTHRLGACTARGTATRALPSRLLDPGGGLLLSPSRPAGRMSRPSARSSTPPLSPCVTGLGSSVARPGGACRCTPEARRESKNFPLKVWAALLELGCAGPTTYRWRSPASCVGLAGGARAVARPSAPTGRGLSLATTCCARTVASGISLGTDRQRGDARVAERRRGIREAGAANGASRLRSRATHAHKFLPVTLGPQGPLRRPSARSCQFPDISLKSY